ncbi:RebB family R body protein [Pseudoalteromonas sp. DL2-H2.2]|uniref:RebB family R body protein n=1 Tax=Pseudoalteromonas sp. DL2-H2.2 TaxID=2908889 RepID=UPI001F405445|nr:RebB family R body protein [Pseudoalteromonas sp. DL2-H2.2]MCF2909649.1 RebB family R body protein [Pseudoalteromonas sp. DL2-H2.2]
MAFPTAVNSQITDAVTQVNTKVLGDTPAVAMGNLMLTSSQALASTAQRSALSHKFSMSPIAQGVSSLYSLDTASTGIATRRILNRG